MWKGRSYSFLGWELNDVGIGIGAKLSIEWEQMSFKIGARLGIRKGEKIGMVEEQIIWQGRR